MEQVQVFCVTDSLTQDECGLLRFKMYTDTQKAIQDAMDVMGAEAKIGIIPCGGETLVRCTTNDRITGRSFENEE